MGCGASQSYPRVTRKHTRAVTKATHVFCIHFTQIQGVLTVDDIRIEQIIRPREQLGLLEGGESDKWSSSGGGVQAIGNKATPREPSMEMHHLYVADFEHSLNEKVAQPHRLVIRVASMRLAMEHQACFRQNPAEFAVVPGTVPHEQPIV